MIFKKDSCEPIPLNLGEGWSCVFSSLTYDDDKAGLSQDQALFKGPNNLFIDVTGNEIEWEENGNLLQDKYFVTIVYSYGEVSTWIKLIPEPIKCCNEEEVIIAVESLSKIFK